MTYYPSGERLLQVAAVLRDQEGPFRLTALLDTMEPVMARMTAYKAFHHLLEMGMVVRTDDGYVTVPEALDALTGGDQRGDDNHDDTHHTYRGGDRMISLAQLLAEVQDAMTLKRDMAYESNVQSIPMIAEVRWTEGAAYARVYIQAHGITMGSIHALHMSVCDGVVTLAGYSGSVSAYWPELNEAPEDAVQPTEDADLDEDEDDESGKDDRGED